MKAHIVSPIPERVLVYAVEQELRPKLTTVLQRLSIEEYIVSDLDLAQDVGYLAGFPGFASKEEAVSAPPACGGVLCMCGISNQRMNLLLKSLREEEIVIPLKAMVTATNQRWSFVKLIEELSKEHQAILQQKKEKA
ncbi:MAG: DUF3783 domain-containing protein [Oscillospiraceae bacterium]|jgi:RNA-splicing ligase RtcB